MKALGRKQLLALLGIASVITGVVAVPLLAQHFFGADPIRVLFVLTVIYAGISFYMRRRREA